MSEIVRWNAELQRRGRFLNERILKDLLGSASSPLFLAQLEGVQLGWFDAIYDERSTEEIVIEQSVTGGGSPIVWASFNKRSQARESALHAHEDKSVTDLVGYSVNGPPRFLPLPARSCRFLKGTAIYPSLLPSEGVVGMKLPSGSRTRRMLRRNPAIAAQEPRP